MLNYFKSLALAELKKLNAAKLEEKRREEMQAAGIDSGPPKPQVLSGTRFRTSKTSGMIGTRFRHQGCIFSQKIFSPLLENYFFP